MPAIVAIAIKDLRTFTRQRASLFFTFIWPICVAVLFGVLFGGSDRPSPRLPIAVVDEDGTDASRAFADRLLAREEFQAIRATRTEALEAVRRGNRVAAVVLRPGFGEASGRMFYGPAPEVHVFTDPGRQAERGMLEGLLMQQGAERLQTLFSNPVESRRNVQSALGDLRKAGGPPRPALDTFLQQLDTFLASSDGQQVAKADSGSGGGNGSGDGSASFTPLRVTMADLQRQRSGPRNGYDVTFPQAMLWAVFGCVMAFGTTFVSERVRGTLVRLQVAPLTRGQVLAGKSLAALLAIFIVETMLLLLGVIGFGVRPSSWVALFAAIGCTSAAFVGIILLLASMAHTEHGIGGMGPAVMMPMFLVGGAMIPLMVMPPWLVGLSYVSPVRWAILGLEGAIWRDFTALEMATPCAVLVGVAVVTFLIGAWRQEAD